MGFENEFSKNPSEEKNEENLENAKESNPEQLNLKEAQEEANMLRKQMRMIPGTGRIVKEVELSGGPDAHFHAYKEKEPTSEDYEVAFNTLSELEKLAEERPDLLSNISKHLAVSFLGTTMPFVLLGNILKEIKYKMVNEGPVLGDKGIIKGSIEETGQTFTKIKDEIFSDARSRLERMRREGEKWGEEAASSEKLKKEKL